MESELKTLMSAGLPIAYADVGRGKTIILAHCSSASHRMWRGLIEALKGEYRIIAPDFIGYGQSAAWPDGRPFDGAADAQVLVDLARLANGPVHFVGHGYGGAMVLEAVRRLRGRARAMTLIEPVAFPLLRAAGREAEWRTVEAVMDAVDSRLAAGDRAGAASAYMGFWLGRLNWWMSPGKLKRNIVETVEKVGLEFRSARQTAAPGLDAFKALDVATLLMHGSRTRQPAKAVVQILGGCLPDARVEAIAGAGHMSPISHRDEVYALIREHIRECAQIRFNQTARSLAGNAPIIVMPAPEWRRGERHCEM